MKYLLVVLMLLPSMVHAKDCVLQEKAAFTVMEARQEKMSLPQILSYLPEGNTGDLEAMIIDAYSSPLHARLEPKYKAAKEFSNKYLIKCYKDNQ